VKVALVAIAVFVAFAAGWWVRGVQEERKTVAAPAVATPAAQAQAEKCRDDCEQRNIIQRLGDDWLRNCRFACNGPPKPYEPIRSITRAPADHSRQERR